VKPIYFPFTYVTRPVAEAMASFFGRTIIYQASAKEPPSAMQPLVRSGLLQIRIPDSTGQLEWDQALKDFRVWAELHFGSRGITTTFFQAASEPIPFFDGSAASRILADIKSGMKPRQIPKDPDSLFFARIFLEFAQEFDRQSHEVTQDFAAHEKSARKLFKSMKGEKGPLTHRNADDARLDAGNSVEYLVFKRLEAWTHLLQKDQGPSGLFVTTSRSIIEYMLDALPGVEKIYQAEAPLCVPSDLLAHFARLAQNRRSAAPIALKNAFADRGAGRQASLAAYRVPGLTPLDCFGRIVGKRFSPSGGFARPGALKNTLIGLIEF
jgi:hypothetical protein